MIMKYILKSPEDHSEELEEKFKQNETYVAAEKTYYDCIKGLDKKTRNEIDDKARFVEAIGKQGKKYIGIMDYINCDGDFMGENVLPAIKNEADDIYYRISTIAGEQVYKEIEPEIGALESLLLEGAFEAGFKAGLRMAMNCMTN